MVQRRMFVGAAAMAVLVVLVGLWWLAPAAAQSASTTSRGSGSDVVMLRCTTSGAIFPVAAYQGSASAPTRRSENCSETLSLLKRDGFSIESVSVFDQESDYLVFTLIR